MAKGDIKGSSVSLYTWGTHTNGGNGMAHFLDASFFGGNVGHAAIEITFPANQESKQLIQQYCLKGNKKVIPFERTTQNILDENNRVKKQDVYKVYFSWWPGSDAGFDLRKNMNTDNVSERIGVDVGELDPRFAQSREKRTYHGPLGSRTVNLADKEIAHLTSLNPDQKTLLETQRKINDVADAFEAIGVLEKKLSVSETLIVEGSLLQLLQQHVNNWQANVKNPRALDKEDITKIKEDLQGKKQELTEEHDILTTKRDILIGTMELEKNDKIKTEITQIRALSEIERLPLLAKKDERFSAQAWVDYELEEVSKILDPAQSVAIFCQMTPFNSQKDKILAVLFDQTYPPNLKDTQNIEQWRQFLPEEHKHVTKETMTKDIFDQVQKNAKSQKDLMFDKQMILFAEKQLVDKVDPLLQGDYQSVLTRGHSPDNVVRMPVSGLQASENFQRGLNIERMLKKMRHLADDGKKFNLATKNCSATTGQILASGAEPSLRSYFQEKAWGGFGNPQEVFNGALKYQHSITANQGKKTFLENLSAWNPLNAISWLGGKMLNKAANPDTPLLGKIALGVGLIPMAGLACAAETIKAVLNPKKTFENCTQFAQYAWKNNSIFLKLCSIPAALMAAAMAIPAALQYGVQKAIIEPLSKTSNERAIQLEKEQQQLPVIHRVKLTKDKLAEVDDPNPVTALATLQQLLHEHPDKIPVFSPKTQLSVNNYLKSLNKMNPEQAATLQSYDASVKQIFAKTNAPVLPPQQFEPMNDRPRQASLNAFARHREQANEDLNPIVPPSDPTPQRQPLRPE